MILSSDVVETESCNLRTTEEEVTVWTVFALLTVWKVIDLTTLVRGCEDDGGADAEEESELELHDD